MKKGLLVFALSLIVVVSGYATTVSSVADKPKESVESWSVESNNNLTTVEETENSIEIEDAGSVESSCETCTPEVEEKKQVNCAKKVKVVRYANKCANGCGFPVSVRVESNCPNEGDK